MRKKNAGRWKWLLLRQREPLWWGPNNPYRHEPEYKVIKTGGGNSSAYENWETLGEYDDPETARAVLDVVRVPSN